MRQKLKSDAILYGEEYILHGSKTSFFLMNFTLSVETVILTRHQVFIHIY